MYSNQQSYFLAANAGSGKTNNLIDRILALIFSGTDLEKILALTFTNAAATEMKQRVTAKLTELQQVDDAELEKFCQEFYGSENYALAKIKEQISKSLYLLPQLKIQTIHAYCQNILTKYAFEAGLKPGLQIMDSNYAKEIATRAQEELFKNPVLKDVLDKLLSRFHYNIISEILAEIITKRTKIIYLINKSGGFATYLEKLKNIFALKPLENYAEILVAQLKEQISYEFFQELYAQAKLIPDALTPDKLALLKKLQQPELFSLRDLQQLCCTKSKSFAKRPFKKVLTSKILDYEIKLEQLRNSYEAYYEQYKLQRYFDLNGDFLLVAQIFLEHYAQLKSQENLLDYEDIILKTLELYQDPEFGQQILYNQDYKFEHILVDEAQDTNPWQWEIIALLSADFFSGAGAKEHKTLFIVGDEKQSIYSFQGVVRESFYQAKENFAQKFAHIKQEFTEINLENSYRSQAAILQLVDKLAEQQEVQYSLSDSQVTHQAVRKTANCKIELWPALEHDEEQETNEFMAFPKQPKQEATTEHIAAKLAEHLEQFLASQKILSATGEVLCPGDILILCRKRDRHYQEVLKALEARDIKFSSDQKFKLSDYVLIMDLLGFLRFILFPQDELNLAAILKSPLFALNESELYALCQGRKSSLVESIASKASTQDLWQKLENLKSLFKNCQASLPEFYLYLLENLGLRRKYLEIYGQKAEKLCDAFLGCVTDFAKFNDNPKDFLEFIINYEPEIQDEINFVNDRVRVLTIHQAKGLQAPIVYLLTDDVSSNKMRREYFITQDDLVLANLSEKPEILEKYFSNYQEQQQAETWRLLYVALTRAQDELYILPANKQGKKNLWQEILLEVAEQLNYHETESGKLIFKTEQQSTKIKKQQQVKQGQQKELNFLAKTQQANLADLEFTEPQENQATKIGQLYHQAFYLWRAGYQSDFIKDYLAKNAVAESEQIIADLEQIANSEAAKLLFAASGYAELELTMQENGQLKRGQLDLLVQDGNHFKIIDYKYEQLTEIPLAYQQQLDFYEKLVRANFTAVEKLDKYLYSIINQKLIKVA